MKAYDVVIVGGGIVGSSAAYFLKKQGFKGTVALIERDTSYANGCTARSCGGIRQQFSTPENISLSKFGLNILRHLKEEFGPEADVSFREQGYLILASDNGKAILEENHAIQVENGADNVLLDAQGLAKEFPWLVTDGLVLGCFGKSGEVWLDPYALMNLFRKAAAGRGVEVIQGEVASVKRTGGRASSLTLADGTEIACGTLVN